ncbi:MAG: tRNA lysidine(34) synthetase TilS [Victivallaceae bacterium]|nr:tRNA lysidine(34) synthetase TilS [Victivallaceae bacterium]
MISHTIGKALENFCAFKVYIGFSGGADSVALLISTNDFVRELDIDITAVHFEHGIRGEASRLDALWCRDFCRCRGIKYEQYDLRVPEESRKSENLEAAARRLRIAKWHELIRRQEKCVVLLGHHADDRIENMFIRLCRGANVSGLTSLREETAVKNIKFIRPLLAFSKLDLIEFLTERGIAEWCVDHSNFDESYTRNYFRHRIIPEIIEKLPTAATGLIKAAKALEADALFIEESAREKYSQVAGQEITGTKFWRPLPPALRARVLRYWLSALLKTEFIPTYDIIERFQEALEQKGGRQILVPLSGDSFIWLHRGEVGLTLESSVETDELVWNRLEEETINYGGKTFKVRISGEFDRGAVNPAVAAFDADLLPAKLILSRRRSGDKMIPFGGSRHIRLKKILTERKLTAVEKENLIVFRAEDGKIIWVPEIRHSAFAPVSEKTGSIAYIEMTG